MGDESGREPVPRRFVDLSIYLENDVITDPPFMRPRIEYQSHRETVGYLRAP